MHFSYIIFPQPSGQLYKELIVLFSIFPGENSKFREIDLLKVTELISGGAKIQVQGDLTPNPKFFTLLLLM